MNSKRFPEVSIGILTAEEIRLELYGTFLNKENGQQVSGNITLGKENAGLLLMPANPTENSFKLFEVTIGIGFHWQQKEDQVFRGELKIIPASEGITLVNVISVEDYLKSVISSEMSATSSTEMLKAHAVISRSWLLAQIAKGRKMKRQDDKYQSSFCSDKEMIVWYDREDHEGFDVCADDHCQRYQGITRATTSAVEHAVNATAGEILIYKDRICDARFSKCCGGVTELFENVWEPVHHPYLQRVYDSDGSVDVDPGDLSDELSARNWILSLPHTNCNTADPAILSQVLNNYDQTTHDFFRWQVSYTGPELGDLIKSKTGIDFGIIHELTPVQRGVSGRIIKLRVAGENKTLIIGKELEIRKALSKTHLYSSAFVIEKDSSGEVPVFIIRGAGWGHGVGLCQIGAAVMGAKGYSYRDILLHYYRGAEIRKRY